MPVAYCTTRNKDRQTTIQRFHFHMTQLDWKLNVSIDRKLRDELVPYARTKSRDDAHVRPTTAVNWISNEPPDLDRGDAVATRTVTSFSSPC